MFHFAKKAKVEPGLSGFLASVLVESIWSFAFFAAPVVGIIFSLKEIFSL